MQAERDQLVSKVFPTLRKLAAQRNVTLTEVDLRWGITEEEAESRKVVEICMDEIQNSHPFFIGILGNRYGWCPTKEELLRDDALPERYAWIADDLDHGLSITEIEILYGVLRAKKEIFASFYIKNEKTNSPDHRQEQLKQIIYQQQSHPVYQYNNVEELGEQVAEEFQKLLDRLYPKDEDIDPVSQERMLQQSYITEKTKTYVPDTAYLTFLNDFLKRKEEQYLVITGESGIGKSALLAYWLKDIYAQNELNIIVHFSANSSYKSSPIEITQKLINEICQLYHLPNTRNTGKQAPEESSQKQSGKEKLSALLQSIGKMKPLLIVLDGVNQFTDENNETKQMNWLPDFPENVQVIFSTTIDDSSMKTFHLRNYTIMKIYPLLTDQRRELINQYFSQYRKRLSPEQLKLILKNSHVTDNTMVLISLLEELRCFGKFEDLTRFIYEMTAEQDYSTFFQRLLQRKETIYNNDKYPYLVRDILSLIAASKEGLEETEIMEISGIPALYWSQFYCANSLFFINRNGRIMFSHNLISEAVIQRYFNDNSDFVTTLRQNIIIYFNQKDKNSDKAKKELPYQYCSCQEYDNLYTYISKLGYLQYQINNNNIHEFVYYWRILSEIDPYLYDISVYIRGITEFKGADANDVQMDAMMRFQFWQMFNNYFIHLSNICINYLDNTEAAYKIVYFLLKMCDFIPQEDTSSIKTTCLDMIGIIDTKRKNYMLALKDYSKLLGIKSKLYEEDSLSITGTLSNTANIYTCLGEEYEETEYFYKAEAIFQKVLDIRLQNLGELHTEVAVIYGNLAGIYHALGKTEKANEFSKRSRDIYICLRGENDLDVAIEYHNQSLAYLKEKKFDIAEVYMKKALEIYLNIVGENSIHTRECYEALGKIAEYQSDYEKAVQYMECLIDLHGKAEGRNIQLAKFIFMACKDYYFNEQPDIALQKGQEALNILQELNEGNSETAAGIYETLGKIYLKINQKQLSVENYLKAIQIWTLLNNPEKTANTYSYLGNAYYTFGQIQEACSAIETSINLQDKCNQTISEASAYNHFNYGAILYKLGQIQDAIDQVLHARDIRIELFGEDDEMANNYEQNAQQLINLADSQTKNNNEEEANEEEINEEIEEFRLYAQNDPELEEFFIAGQQAFRQREIEQAILMLKMPCTSVIKRK